MEENESVSAVLHAFQTHGSSPPSGCANSAQPFLSPEEESALIAKAQAGDHEATEQLLTAFEPLVWTTVKRYRHGPRTAKDIAHAVRLCLLDAIKTFDVSKGLRLGTLAKTIISRRLPRQVSQQAQHGDALSHSEPRIESDRSATMPRSLTPVQQAARIEVANVLRQVRQAALTPGEQDLISVHYDEGHNVTEAAHRLGISRPTFYKRHDAAIGAMHDTLVGTGFNLDDARSYLAALSREPVMPTAPKLKPKDLNVTAKDAPADLEARAPRSYGYWTGGNQVTDSELFRPKRSDPPAVRLLKAIFAADEKRDREMAGHQLEVAEQSSEAEEDFLSWTTLVIATTKATKDK